MKRLISLLPLFFLHSCAWIAANPQVDAEVIEIAEELTSDLYRYESRKIPPGRLLPPGTPPLKAAK